MTEYQLRGNRVTPMQEEEIASIAMGFFYEFGLSNVPTNRLDIIFEKLGEYPTISLDILTDKRWEKETKNLTNGHFDHSTGTIRVPQRIYMKACKGEKEQLFIMLHELGHLFLGHKPVLHNSHIPPKRNEDAEWQADTFANIILEQLGYIDMQLSFDFDGM